MINYYLITKPGIILGNLITLGAGFILASQGGFDPWLFASTFLGLALIVASACIFNNYIDRELDQKMERTKKRALACGAVSLRSALLFALLLGAIGSMLLLVCTNFLAFFLAFLGFFVYVFIYSLWKAHTVYATAVGSVAGAVPPVVGYCAVSGSLDVGALLLFAMMVLWQMPHFFAIALMRFDDYLAANIPTLPIQRGVWRTKVHMALYIFFFIGVCSLFSYFGYTGDLFLFVAVGAGLLWLIVCLSGFVVSDDSAWGRSMFRLSLAILMAICSSLLIELL